ncbi:twin-arginine translocation signal domain-containing protein [Haloarcula laminariae]|uniref:twin-arginine translocation signal domain-containing protein n=1 Tax=Haloarcula laminariae TaxID=2961577 RepID=UPI0021CA6CDD|nr:twin-arginine translocation signal domain-containing protein [Halomicroarcula laminariae]
MSDKGKSYRRQFIKGLGVGAATVTVPAGSAFGRRRQTSKKPEEIYKEALELRKETGDSEKFDEYLKERGFKGYNTSATKEVQPTKSDSEKEIDRESYDLTKCHGDLDLYTYESTDDAWCDLELTIHEDGYAGEAEPPNDVIGLYWPTDHFDRVPESEYGYPLTYIYTPTDNPTKGDISGNGVAVEYDDVAHNEDNAGDPVGDGWEVTVGCNMNIDDDDVETRRIFADWTHTRSIANLEGISNIGISAAGLSVNLDTGQNKDNAVWEAKEE